MVETDGPNLPYDGRKKANFLLFAEHFYAFHLGLPVSQAYRELGCVYGEPADGLRALVDSYYSDHRAPEVKAHQDPLHAIQERLRNRQREKARALQQLRTRRGRQS